MSGRKGIWNKILSVLGASRTPAPMTVEQVRALYAPPRTLGAPEEAVIAMDSALADAGVYDMIADDIATQTTFLPRFMGYAQLQNIAQDGLVRACVETVADDMTRAWIELKQQGANKKAGTGQADKGGQDTLTDLAQAMEKIGMQAVFHEAVELVGYEGGAFIFIDTGADPQTLETPLNISQYSAELQKGMQLRFKVVDPICVTPGAYDTVSPLSPHYFKPRWWWVQGKPVHASRLIRLVANEVPVLIRPAYNFFGIPQAQILWDYVRHFQECREASVRLLTKFSLTVLKTNMTDILQSPEGLALFDARIGYFNKEKKNEGLMAIDMQSEDIVKLETPLSGVTDIVRQSLEILAAMNRTPAVKLLGISPSGFNATGESDIRNYYDHIVSQQEKVLRASIKKALDCVQLHLKGEIDPTLTFDFAPLGQEDRAALATMQKTRADTIAVYVDRGILSSEEARKAVAEDPDSGFSDIDPEDVPDLDTEVPGAEIDDVDKAGAVFDADEWRTSKQGKYYQIDTETGEITKGNIGQENPPQARPLESTEPDMERYQALLKEQDGDHKKAAATAK